MGEGRGMYRVLVGKPEGKKVVGCKGMDWIELAQDREVVGTCECVNEHSGSIKCGEFLD
jgi:hypothetical protein